MFFWDTRVEIDVGSNAIAPVAGLGSSSRELVAGIDCPTTAQFIDTSLWDKGALIYRNAICVFELDTGVPLRRHDDLVNEVDITLLVLCSRSVLGADVFSSPHIWHALGNGGKKRGSRAGLHTAVPHDARDRIWNHHVCPVAGHQSLAMESSVRYIWDAVASAHDGKLSCVHAGVWRSEGPGTGCPSHCFSVYALLLYACQFGHIQLRPGAARPECVCCTDNQAQSTYFCTQAATCILNRQHCFSLRKHRHNGAIWSHPC